MLSGTDGKEEIHMTEDQAVHKGQCLCGALRYEVQGPLTDLHACHCSMCQRQGGHFAMATGAKRADFKLTAGGTLKWYRSSDFAQRGFCADCGSSLFWQSDKADYTAIFAGSLDDGAGVRLAAHIFVADKGDYYDIADGQPRLEQGGHGLWPE